VLRCGARPSRTAHGRLDMGSTLYLARHMEQRKTIFGEERRSAGARSLAVVPLIATDRTADNQRLQTRSVILRGAGDAADRADCRPELFLGGVRTSLQAHNWTAATW